MYICVCLCSPICRYVRLMSVCVQTKCCCFFSSSPAFWSTCFLSLFRRACSRCLIRSWISLLLKLHSCGPAVNSTPCRPSCDFHIFSLSYTSTPMVACSIIVTRAHGRILWVGLVVFERGLVGASIADHRFSHVVPNLNSFSRG